MVKTNQMHTGGGGRGERERGWMRGTSCTTSKDFEKIGHINAKNTKIDNPPLFSHNPKYRPQKNLKITLHLCKKQIIIAF
jgi:hypothetical protein